MKPALLAAFAAGVLAVVPATPPLSAQSIRFGVGAGLQMPIGDYAGQDKLGWVAGGGGTYWLRSGKLGIRGDLSYAQTAHDTSGGSTKIFGAMASAVYALRTSAASARPYVMGGLGYYNVDIEVTPFPSASESKLGFAAGAGVSFRMGTGGKRWFAETRFTSVRTSGVSTTFFPIIVGISVGR
ncbi:MAG TPA: outer membrane beta-barrel protein [Gemmatimonadales bacterium]|jgi:opacity protein-like surface antigen|nr:outer membrane beta-barrel protein [Gemmatimonadales bacterium]